MKHDKAIDRPHPYHHGDLRRALLDATLESIAENGPTSLSLRELARRSGVSHAAPAHHFGDKAGLLTALAAEGFRLLAATLGEVYARTGSFLEVGVAYVGFALEHRAYFAVMFRPDLYHTDNPELAEAREAARALLYGPVLEMEEGTGDMETLRLGVAAWSLAHGLATLWIGGNLPPALGNDPELIARAVLNQLTLPRGNSGG